MTRRSFRLSVLLLLLSALMLLGQYAPLLLDEWRSRDLNSVQRLMAGLEAQDATVYLRQYHLTPEEFEAQWNDVLLARPDFFFVDSESTYAATANGEIFSVTPHYLLTGEALQRARAEYRAALQSITDTVDPRWTPLEQALYLHDYLVTHYRYDENGTNFDAYRMLREGVGVCQAYTLLYQALLDAQGIGCHAVVSEEMNHSWNVVRLEDSWFSVDVTYDDPTFDRLGHVSHRYFCISDPLLAQDHTGGTPEFVCTDTRYDDAPWREATSAIVPLDGAFYCICENELCRWEGDALTPIYTIDALWYVSGAQDQYWEGCYASLATDGAALLFSTPRTVCRFDPATGTVSTAAQYEGDGDIYGFVYENGEALCQIAPSPNESGTLARLPLA